VDAPVKPHACCLPRKSIVVLKPLHGSLKKCFYSVLVICSEFAMGDPFSEPNFGARIFCEGVL
jgi:hypothetical protein